MNRKQSVADKRHLAKVAAMGCVVCSECLGYEDTPAVVHHVHVEFGWGRTSHFDTIPLCPPHHVGPGMSVHGMGREEFTLGQSLSVNLGKLRQASTHLNTFAKLAKRAGVGGGTVERAEKNTVSVTLETVEKLASALDVDPIFLLREPDHGPMAFTELNALEAQLVMLYRSLPESERDRLLLFANDLHNSTQPNKPTPANPFPHPTRRFPHK